MDDSLGRVDDLLKQHAHADPEVIEAVVQDYRAPIFRLAFSILCNADDAEDATQETLIQAARNLGRYQQGTSFRAWIFTIAVNTCRGSLRKRKTRAGLQSVLNSIQALIHSEVDPETAVVQEERGSHLREVVERLPEKQRLVVILHMVHEMSIPEVAQVLHVNQKTVYSRLYLAFRSLRKQLQPLTSEWIEVENRGEL